MPYVTSNSNLYEQDTSSSPHASDYTHPKKITVFDDLIST